MGISKLTRNFRVTIPKDVREVKRLKQGDRVLFAIDGETVELHKIDENAISAAVGRWRNAPDAGLEYERRVRQPWAKRTRRDPR